MEILPVVLFKRFSFPNGCAFRKFWVTSGLISLVFTVCQLVHDMTFIVPDCTVKKFELKTFKVSARCRSSSFLVYIVRIILVLPARKEQRRTASSCSSSFKVTTNGCVCLNLDNHRVRQGNSLWALRKLCTIMSNANLIIMRSFFLTDLFRLWFFFSFRVTISCWGQEGVSINDVTGLTDGVGQSLFWCCVRGRS